MKQYNYKEIKYPAIPRNKRNTENTSASVVFTGNSGLTGSEPVFDVTDHGRLTGIINTASQYSEFARDIHLTAADADKLKNLTGIQIIPSDQLSSIAPTDQNVYSAVSTDLRISKELDDFLIEINGMYLRKDIDDTMHGALSLDKRMNSSVFIDGWDGKGWEIKETGAAQLDSLRLRYDLLVGNRLGSPSFISGFPEGRGWDLSPYKRYNATGAEETKWRLELDDLVVRGKARFFELIASQLRGENDNFIFAGQMKVAYYDIASKRIYLDTEKGLLYNPFRAGDILIVQRFGGLPSAGNNYNVVKQYELQVTDAGIGSEIEGEGRLDWITFKNLVGDLSDITDGDVLTRADSAIDSTRKGIVKVTTIDEIGAPHLDVVYGMKTQPDDSVKARLGNLAGIRTKGGRNLTDQWGLYAQGAFIENSTILLENGDTIEQTFSAMNGKFDSTISEIRSDISLERGNILRNPSFNRDTNYWTSDNRVHFIPVGDKYLWMDDAFYVEKAAVADIYNDNGRNVLRVRNTVISQYNEVMNIPPHSGNSEAEYAYSFAFYAKVLHPGTLSAGIPGTALFLEKQLDASGSYERITQFGQWNEKGNFQIKFTGEILIYGVSVFNDTLADTQVKLQTQIDQTSEYIKLLATKDYVDSETGQIYTHYDSQFLVTAGQISGISTRVDNINNRIDTAGWITEPYGNTIYANKKTVENLTGRVSTAESSISNNAYSITQKVSTTDFNGQTIISKVNQTASAYQIDAKNINLNGKVTFSMFDPKLTSDFNGKANSSSLKAMAYLDKVEKAQLGTTVISNGHIITSLIDTDSIYANMASIGDFSIKNGWLTCNANTGKDVGYIDMRGTNTRISFGHDLTPDIVGGAFINTAVIHNKQANYLSGNIFNWDSGGNKNIGLEVVSRGCDFPVGIVSEGYNSFVGGLSVVTFVPKINSTSYDSKSLRYSDIVVLQTSSEMNFDLPTLSKLYEIYNNGGNYMSNGLALNYQVVIKFSFLLTRYSKVVHFRGNSTIPIIDGKGSIHQWEGNYQYGTHKTYPGEVITFYYHNNHYYLSSNHNAV